MKNIFKLTFSMVLMFSLFSFKSVNMKFLPTKLKITVLDELGNQVEGAKVTLFKTEEDYRAETNPVGVPAITDEDGKAKIGDLEPIQYYVLAEKGKKANHGAGVKTQKLEEGKTNRINTVIR
ncbi:MAG: carboxypeptidase regulatory-like domain-containing protein [Reichenbachiella sp.]